MTTHHAAGILTPVLFSLLRTTAAFQLPGKSEVDQEKETLTYICHCCGRPYRASDSASITVTHSGNQHLKHGDISGQREKVFIRKENYYGIRKEGQIHIYLVYSLRFKKKKNYSSISNKRVDRYKR